MVRSCCSKPAYGTTKAGIGACRGLRLVAVCEDAAMRSIGRDGTVVLERPEDYDDDLAVAVQATQLDVSRSMATRIVAEWCDFFRSGPSQIRELEFTSRTPKRLFAALEGQTQLQSLITKWGDYDDLTPLGGMRSLETLELHSAPALIDLNPIADIPSLRSLVLIGTFRVHDYSPIGACKRLEYLAVHPGTERGKSTTPNLEFLTELPMLRDLSFGVEPDDRDWSPILRLQHVDRIHIAGPTDMRPTMLDLEWAVPGVAMAITEQHDWDESHHWVEDHPSDESP